MQFSCLRLVVLAPLLLAGCVTSNKYAAMQEAMSGSPQLIATMTEECTVKMASSESDRQVRALMKLGPKDSVARTGCKRIFDAIASGRLTYDDYGDMQRGDITPKVIRVLQGR